MKAKELQLKSDKELQIVLQEKREKMGALKFDIATTKKLKNISEIKEMKKDIARVLTILNKRRKENK